MKDPSQPATQTTIAGSTTQKGVTKIEFGKPPYGAQKDSNHTGGYKILY